MSYMWRQRGSRSMDLAIAAVMRDDSRRADLTTAVARRYGGVAARPAAGRPGSLDGLGWLRWALWAYVGFCNFILLY